MAVDLKPLITSELVDEVRDLKQYEADPKAFLTSPPVLPPRHRGFMLNKFVSPLTPMLEDIDSSARETTG